MKEFTNVAANVTSFAGNMNFLFPSWKEWLLSKKEPEDVERVARGHFHERVGVQLKFYGL